jgi:hypothetical protein
MRNPFTRTATVTAAVVCAAAVTVTGTGAATAATKPPSKPTLKTATVHITGATTVTAKTSFKEVLRGTVTYRGTGLAGRTVLLKVRSLGGTRWTTINHRKTTKATTGKTATKAGTVSFTVTQSGRVEQYELVLVAGGGYATATSKVLTVKKA